MKRALLDQLICPCCLPWERALQESVVAEEGRDIVEGNLICSTCGTLFPIREGVAFLDPAPTRHTPAMSKYETESVVASYLWSHFGDLLEDPEATGAYQEWGEQLHPDAGLCLDVGTAVGRFALDMSAKADFSIGLDNSVAFIKTARELMQKRQMTVVLPEEGELTREVELRLPASMDSDRVEFIVGDAQALPFPSRSLAMLASLNMLDKVPRPLAHMAEINRTARLRGAQCLISDPFSWSEEAARQEDWLGGKATGPFAGRGLDNVLKLLQGEDGSEPPAWIIEGQGRVWWKIRSHSNHFELIRSCYVKASR